MTFFYFIVDPEYTVRKLRQNNLFQPKHLDSIKSRSSTLHPFTLHEVNISAINNKLVKIHNYNDHIHQHTYLNQNPPDDVSERHIEQRVNLSRVQTLDHDNQQEIGYKPEIKNTPPKSLSPLVHTIRHHVYIAAPGRLGNQMFQYAVGYTLAISQNRIPVLQMFTAEEIQRMFEIDHTVQVSSIPPGLPVIDEQGAGIYTSSFLRLPNEDLTICCYFQSWRYLNKPFTQKLFSIRVDIVRKSQDLIENLSKTYKRLSKQRYSINLANKQLTYVGLHIRQTDYILQSSIDKGYRAAPIKYILQAMIFYEKWYPHVVFITCSDNKQWVRKNFSWKSNMLIIPWNSDTLDFSTLTQCNHTIITTGTFGWWAAYLTNGNVTYYSDWLLKDSEIGRVYNAIDYFPPDWIPLTG